jgi:hypothetical protein
MRQAYAHEALLVMDPDGDDRGPGAAITVALCGRLEHEPPCPLAAHHTAAERRDGRLHLRVLFATAPDRVDEVRDKIDEALGAGTFRGPDGEPSRWQLVRAGCTEVSTGERPHARRLLKN